MAAIAACQSHPDGVASKKPASAAPPHPTLLTPPPGTITPTHGPTTGTTPNPGGSGGLLASPGVPPVSPGPGTPPPPTLSALLAGHVSAPAGIIANNGGGIISDTGGSILANNGGGLISDQGSNVIANNGGNIISNHGGGYHLDATGGAGLANAFLYLTNRDEKFYLDHGTGQAFAAATGTDGSYSFPITADNGFPVGKDVIVNALLNENQRMTGFILPVNGKNTLEVTLATTLTTELLRAQAARQGKALKDYDATLVARAVSETQGAIDAGDVAVSRSVTDASGQTSTSAVFDLRLQHVDRLRNQYVVAFSAVDAAKSTLHTLSDTWRQLFGTRPSAVTTVMGNGGVPVIDTTHPGSTGDGTAPDPAAVPVGYCSGIAVGAHGDIFYTADGNDSGDGHVRWLEAGGPVATLWFPSFKLEQPGGVAVEKEPGGDQASSPGSVLIAGSSADFIVRVYAVDHAVTGADGNPRWPQELVSGEFLPVDAASEPDHPAVVDNLNDVPDTSKPATAYWRLGDEGPRTYASNGQPVPSPARFAHLNHPNDVAVDEEGNIYIADTWNQRVRMIPKVAGSYFGYRQPFDDDKDGVVDRFGAATPLVAGCIYTIAGNPAWDAARTPDQGGHWFGDYAGDGGAAQQAKLAGPTSLAFANGYLYVVDHDNQRIRRISRSTGIIETVAGNPPGPQTSNGSYFYFPGGDAGDGGPAGQAQLNNPQGIAVDAKDRVYFYDAGSRRIRMVDMGTSSHPITTVAGHAPDAVGSFGALDGDGDALYGVTLADVRGLAVDATGNLLITDFANRRIRKLWRQWE